MEATIFVLTIHEFQVLVADSRNNAFSQVFGGVYVAKSPRPSKKSRALLYPEFFIAEFAPLQIQISIFETLYLQ